jgi:hypothetical protein
VPPAWHVDAFVYIDRCDVRCAAQYAMNKSHFVSRAGAPACLAWTFSEPRSGKICSADENLQQSRFDLGTSVSGRKASLVRHRERPLLSSLVAFQGCADRNHRASRPSGVMHALSKITETQSRICERSRSAGPWFAVSAARLVSSRLREKRLQDQRA